MRYNKPNGKIELPHGAHAIPSQLEIAQAQQAGITQFVVNTARDIFVRNVGNEPAEHERHAREALAASKAFAEIALGVKFQNERENEPAQP